jgi:hypothetical protein
MIDKILELTLDEVKTGVYCDADGKKHTCLICGGEFETGEMFEFDGKYYEASRAAKMHVEKEHGSVLGILASYEKNTQVSRTIRRTCWR